MYSDIFPILVKYLMQGTTETAGKITLLLKFIAFSVFGGYSPIAFDLFPKNLPQILH